MVADAGIHMMTFEEVDTGEVFVVEGLKVHGAKKFKGTKVNKARVPKPLKVNSGRYFLKSITPAFSNIVKRKFDKPECENCFFAIKAGGLSYLGRWNVEFDGYSYGDIMGTIKWNIQREYSHESLKMLKRRDTELTDLPLYLPNEEGKVYMIEWKQF